MLNFIFFFLTFLVFSSTVLLTFSAPFKIMNDKGSPDNKQKEALTFIEFHWVFLLLSTKVTSPLRAKLSS